MSSLDTGLSASRRSGWRANLGQSRSHAQSYPLLSNPGHSYSVSFFSCALTTRVYSDARSRSLRANHSLSNVHLLQAGGAEGTAHVEQAVYGREVILARLR